MIGYTYMKVYVSMCVCVWVCVCVCVWRESRLKGVGGQHMGARVRVAGEGGRRASCPAHAGASRSNLNNTSRPPRHQATCHAAGKQRTLAPAHTPRRPSLSSRLHTNLGSTSRVMSRDTCDLPLTTRCAAPPAPFEGPTAWKQRRVHLQAHSMPARTSQARVTRLTSHCMPHTTLAS